MKLQWFESWIVSHRHSEDDACLALKLFHELIAVRDDEREKQAARITELESALRAIVDEAEREYYIFVEHDDDRPHLKRVIDRANNTLDAAPDSTRAKNAQHTQA